MPRDLINILLVIDQQQSTKVTVYETELCSAFLFLFGIWSLLILKKTVT